MYYLGIDIAKDKFDVALISESNKTGTAKKRIFKNNQDGFEKLIAWLNRSCTGEVHACMEATGTYHEDLASFLVASGIKTSVENPMRISNYAKSSAVRNCTDNVSAWVIADYCKAKNPNPWIPPSPEVKELRELCRRLAALQQAKEDEENRLRSGVSSPIVVQSLKETISFLAKQAEDIEKLINSHMDSHPKLKEERDLLVSIPGIADRTAAVILSELPDVKNFTSAKQAAAYAGLSPREHRSGSSVKGKTRLCKIGTARLRGALYFPAIAATRFNPDVKDLYHRLTKAGKPKMCAMGAAMRKLLHIAFGVLKTGQPFTARSEITA